MPPRYLTVAQVAERLGVSRRRVVALVKVGRFPHAEKPARDWLIPVKDVEAFERQPPGRPRKGAPNA